MASLDVKAGTFVAEVATGTKPYTGVGFMPKVVLFWGAKTTTDGITVHGIYGFGCGISSTERAAICVASENDRTSSFTDRRHDNTVAINFVTITTPTEKLAADIVSLDADGFTLDYEIANSGWDIVVNYLALGGDDLEANLVEFDSPITPETKNVAHGLTGGAPDALVVFSGMTSSAAPATAVHAGMTLALCDMTASHDLLSVSADNKGTSDTWRLSESSLVVYTSFSSQAVQWRAVLDSADATNVVFDWNPCGAAALKGYMLALRGVQFKAGTFSTPTSGTTAVTGVGFTPKAALLTSFMGATAAGVQDHARIMIGADDATNAVSAGAVDEDGVEITDTDRIQDSNKSIAIIDHTQVEIASGSVDGWTSDGFNVALTPTKARSFAASSNEWFDRTSETALNPAGDMSICAWVRAASLGVTRGIVGKYHTSLPKRQYLLYQQSANTFNFGVSDDGTAFTAATGGSVVAGRWYFLYGYHDNGTEIGVSVDNGTAVTAAHAGGIFSSDGKYEMGRMTGGTPNDFDGLIGPVGQWDRLLTAGELAWLAKGHRLYADLGGSDAGSDLKTSLIGYWNLDEASGNALDSHTNSLDLTDNNTVTAWTRSTAYEVGYLAIGDAAAGGIIPQVMHHRRMMGVS